MIKKMTKYSFVVFHREVEAFLQKLQEIGVVDVTRQKRAIDSYSMEKFEEIARYIKEYCPNAWVINYTNPMTLCVKTLYRVFPEINDFGYKLNNHTVKLSVAGREAENFQLAMIPLGKPLKNITASSVSKMPYSFFTFTVFSI